jgi:predicted metal-dependent peptidase
VTKELPKNILGARIKLMLDEPYLASAIARFPLVNAEGLDWCETMAVDGFYIYVNPKFCESLNKDEIIFVLAHEVMHCVLGHIDRRGNKDKEVWNYATDYATNLKLVEFGFKMPKVGLIDQRFKDLTSEEIYELLLKEGKESLEKLSKGNNNKDQWDIHLDPSDNRGQEQRKKEFPSPEERKRLRVSILKDISEKIQGSRAGQSSSELTKAKGEEVPWDILLARFFSGLRKDDYRLMPPNKKHIWRDIYLPSIGRPGPNHIVVAIDTSGSMDDQTLKKVLGIIDNLRSFTQCKLTLIQCDAKINKIEEFEEYEPTNFEKYTVIGRGGTSFIPVFHYLDKRQRKETYHFDTLIFITDGFGEFPKEAPNYPTLWLITKGGLDKVPFGEKIKISF